MTDRAAPSMTTSLHTTNEARARLSARYRKERSFKLVGQLAIAVSVGFLVVLLSTIFYKGFPAFSYHFASLPFEMSDLDPNDQDNLKKADYDAIVRDAIRGTFPEVSGRQPLRLLGRLLSSGSPIVLREQVLKKPENLSNPRAYSLPISDFADLYLKGQITPDIWEDGSVPAQFSRTDERATISVDSARFEPVIDAIVERLVSEASAVRKRQAGITVSRDRVEANIASIEARLTSADAIIRADLTAERETLETSLADLSSQIASLQDKASALDARAKHAAADGEQLTSEDLSVFIYYAGGVIKADEIHPTQISGTLLSPFDTTAPTRSDNWRLRLLETPEANRKFSDQEIVWTDELVENGYIENAFNWIFLTRGASREPEMAGVWGAVVGSFLTLVVTLSLSFPLGVAAAIYLEEFAPKNPWTSLIEVNINNLAAVPSIVFGLLGLGIFLNFFGFDRSAPYVGGLVLGLMTLPVIIIASRVSLRAVPPSIREAALGIGASKLQTVLHHVLPLAMPGIMTGAIIGMARALGETAPLLMIGMVAFVVDVPGGFSDPATVLPVQIFMWADFPEPAFEQRTSAAILVLLIFLILMNALAVILRKRFERRW